MPRERSALNPGVWGALPGNRGRHDSAVTGSTEQHITQEWLSERLFLLEKVADPERSERPTLRSVV